MLPNKKRKPHNSSLTLARFRKRWVPPERPETSIFSNMKEGAWIASSGPKGVGLQRRIATRMREVLDVEASTCEAILSQRVS